jgi:hypothetical protein
LILCISLISIGISILYVNHELELVEVYVASENLQSSTLMDEDVIKPIKVPKAYLSEASCFKKEDIVNKYVKLNASIPKGSLIYNRVLNFGGCN